MRFAWSEEKNEFLKATRGISFENVPTAIGSDNDLGTAPNLVHPGEIILIVRIHSYVYLCPAVPSAEGFFLKTIYPSREANKKWGGPKQ
jgi:hypothetical protein